MRWPWRRTNQETELEREVRHHLEMLTEEYERQGMRRPEAMLRARREFGGVEQVKEQCRDERRWRPLAQLGQDLRFGVRMLRKTPAVTATAILSLALGIGATTAMVAIVDAVLWRQLGVPEPRQLSEVLWQSKLRPEGIFRATSGSMFLDSGMHVADFFSHAAFENLRAAGGPVSVAGHINPEDVSTSFEGRPAVARLRPVSGNFFEVLRLQPEFGRAITAEEEKPQSGLAVVVSNEFWRKQLGADPAIAGKAIRINDRPYTVNGVLPASFSGISSGDSTDLYTSVPQSPAILDRGSFYAAGPGDPYRWYIRLIARRNDPAVGHEAAARLLDARFAATWPVARPTNGEEGRPNLLFREAASGLGSVRRDMGNPVSMLLYLVALVLLMACANIANLLLARADARRKEVALRMSLGCSRARLAIQFFTESVLLALLGGLLSIPVGLAAANFAVTLMPGDLRLRFDADIRMALATFGVALLTAVVFGAYPAWRASKLDTVPALKEGAGSIGGGGREGGGGSRGWAAGKALVLAQVALGVLLVAAAVSFNLHLRKILSNDSGFERTRLLLFELRPGQSGHQGERLRQFYLDLEERLREVPGVQYAGLARVRPMAGGGYSDTIQFRALHKELNTSVNFVTSGYLDALGIPITGGRGFTEQDIRSNAAVAVVSEDFAKELGRSPLGLSFEMEGRSMEIVGIARAARYSRMTSQPKVLYVPHSLSRDTLTAVVRTHVPPAQVLAGVKGAVAALDPNLPMVKTVTMEEQIGSTLRRERLFAWLCGAFGCLALVLCMVGLYGVMSYAISRRRQEVGIRMALGASPASVLRMVVSEGLLVTLSGILVGAPVAWWTAAKYFDYKQYEMTPLEPGILAGAIAALVAASMLAILAPALRAASVDPLEALRDE